MQGFCRKIMSNDKIIDRYYEQKRFDLYNSKIKGRKIIYLDLNFWIRLRDQKELKDKLFLSKVKELSNSRKCIFPISQITFLEVLKQSDNETLLQTISLIDEFSEGVSIITTEERIQLEILYFLRSLDNCELHDLDELVWIKIPFLLGYPNIDFMTVNSQKSFLDIIYNQSFTDLFNVIKSSGQEIKAFRFKDDIEALNYNKAVFSHQNNSFRKMFISEIEGYLFEYDLFILDAIKLYFSNKENIDFNKYRSLIYDSCKSNKSSKELSVFKIFPELMASVRWDTDRKHKDGNDTMDFLHASFALPYCDYFFTERELKTRITQQKLDKVYDCQTEYNIDNIIEILDSIICL